MRADSKVLHWRPRARCDQPSHRRVPEPLVLGVSARVSSPRGRLETPRRGARGSGYMDYPRAQCKNFLRGPLQFLHPREIMEVFAVRERHWGGPGPPALARAGACRGGAELWCSQQASLPISELHAHPAGHGARSPGLPRARAAAHGGRGAEPRASQVAELEQVRAGRCGGRAGGPAARGDRGLLALPRHLPAGVQREVP